MSAMFCAPSQHSVHSDDEDVFYNDSAVAAATPDRRVGAASIDQLAEKEFTEARVLTDITETRVINDGLVKSHVRTINCIFFFLSSHHFDDGIFTSLARLSTKSL
jgi:hypothetical protein